MQIQCLKLWGLECLALGKKVFTRVVWSKFNFRLYYMFDTLTLMSVEIFSLVTFVMQFFNSLLMLLLNINAMFLHMLKVKLKHVIVNELLRSVSFFPVKVEFFRFSLVFNLSCADDLVYAKSHDFLSSCSHLSI